MNIKLYYILFSFPRRPRDDLYWLWFFDDVPEEVRTLRSFSESDLLCSGYRSFYAGLWIFPSSLRRPQGIRKSNNKILLLFHAPYILHFSSNFDQIGEDGIPTTINFGSDECDSSWPYIDVNVGTLISADFATAAVLISFGVVLGITSPTQLLVMTLLETIFFVVNEIIGRDYLGAVDAGDTIFVHLFGAYFGLTVARVLYNPDHDRSSKQGASYTSDMFSMVKINILY